MQGIEGNLEPYYISGERNENRENLLEFAGSQIQTKSKIFFNKKREIKMNLMTM